MSKVNTYRVIGFLMTFLPEPVGDYMKAAQSHLRELADAYDALAPDWDSAPGWAQWYAIDADGSAGIFGQEPEVEGLVWVIEWTETSELPVEVGTVDLPLGIDWRLCKWSREGAK